MRKMIPTLVGLARCVARSGRRAAATPGRRALLCPDPRARRARGGYGTELRIHGARECSNLSTDNVREHLERSATGEQGSIYQPVFNIDVLVALLRQENAMDICVIKLPVEIKYSDYFIIVSGTSARHLQAMAQYAVKVHKHLKRGQNPYVHVEGKDADDWKCIDFGNIVVHFMLPETREVYELEKLWTLRSHDDQFAEIPPEILPTDFVYGPTNDVEQKKSDFIKGLF
ncbi:mitochondrial assembly of ribosomal large subunit protein 1 [Heptranchias perlo]|uniref:mitochondrial assembly of ribosomal large subunit protein 1 n=1 Tax=Heptranchias perlo TaxID=212740 RepID=UPI00355A5FF5